MKRVYGIALVWLMIFMSVFGTMNMPVEAKTRIKITAANKTVEVGKTVRVKITGTGSKKVVWSVTKNGVLKIKDKSKKNTVVKAVKAGKGKVTAKVGRKKYSCIIKVKKPAVTESKDFMEFAKELSVLISEHPIDSGKAVEDVNEFYTARLIVKTSDSGVSFDAYSPEAVLESDDNITILQFKTSTQAENAYEKIRSLSSVDWVEADSYIGVSEDITSDKDILLQNVSLTGNGYYDDQHLTWGASVMGVDEYAGYLGSGSAIVAVIDTGVTETSFMDGRLVTGYDFVANDRDASDEHYHGTHVAGTIVDCTPGLDVKIMPVRVLDAAGNGYHSSIALGIRYAVDNGASVINMSLGGGHSDYIDSYVQYALDRGVTVVAAAGNNNTDTAYFCPAHIKGAVVVSAVDSYYNKAYFSNYGNSVDVAAPGVDIMSTIPNGSYASLSGTSMASPHVAALAAMLTIKYPSATPATIESKIKNAAVDIGTAGWDIYYGYGIPDMRNLIGESTEGPDEGNEDNTGNGGNEGNTGNGDNTGNGGNDGNTGNGGNEGNNGNTGNGGNTPVTPAPGGEQTEGSYSYRVTSSYNAVITGYSGSGGNIDIPITLGGYPVSRIGDGAFKGNTSITSVSINGTVTIGAGAFSGCTKLSSLTVSGIVNSVEQKAFADCSSLSQAVIYGMVFAVSQDTFAGCNSLKTAVIYGMVDNSVISAFDACPGKPLVTNYGMITY